MNRNLCIAAVHLRVDESIFLRLIGNIPGEISNAQLVSLSLKAPHQNLTDSFIDKEMNCSYISGISIQKINSNIYTVTHRLPAIFLANFNKSDIKYFTRYSFNAWDHAWPSLLIKQRRYKVVGSSEVFFMTELTKASSHICPNLSSYGNDDYQVTEYIHKEINRNFAVILQADKKFN